jgi:hypothetical protein
MVEWAKETGVEPKRHHRLIIDLLEKVCAGELDRVMILAPPGSAKSYYVSLLFIAWYLAQHPGEDVIAASHTVPQGVTAASQVVRHMERPASTSASATFTTRSTP